MQIFSLFFLIGGHLFKKFDLNTFWWSEWCLLLVCLTMDLREHKNAIKRFLAICLGSCSSLTVLYCEWLPKWWMQWHDVFGNTFYEIYASQNLDRLTIEALRLSFSEIDLFLWKCPPFCLNGLQNGGYNGMMYSAIRFLKSTPRKPIESTMMALRLLVSEIW